jgi:hypothetical protein
MGSVRKTKTNAITPIPPLPNPQLRHKIPSLPNQLRALFLRRASYHHQTLRAKISPMNRHHRRHSRLAPLPGTIHNAARNAGPKQSFLSEVRFKPQPQPGKLDNIRNRHWTLNTGHRPLPVPNWPLATGHRPLSQEIPHPDSVTNFPSRSSLVCSTRCNNGLILSAFIGVSLRQVDFYDP